MERLQDRAIHQQGVRIFDTDPGRNEVRFSSRNHMQGQNARAISASFEQNDLVELFPYRGRT